MTSYEKLKYVVKKLLKGEVIKKNLHEFEIYNISVDTYSKFITKLNDIKILQSISKGENVIKDNYINFTYFYDQDKNASIIASITHLEKKESKFLISEYLFKSVPKNLTFMLMNSYTNKFQKSIIQLLDEKKYKYFASIIEANGNISKMICQIFHREISLFLDIVPLELFIHQNCWYICYYDINQNRLDIIDSLHISESQIKNNRCFQKYISRDDIDAFIKERIQNDFLVSEEFIVLRLKAETLNLLMEFDLIDNFEVYKDDTKENTSKNLIDLNGRFSKININELTKINLYKINFEIEQDNYQNSLEMNKVLFNSSVSEEKKYYVKAIIPNYKLKYIMKHFIDVEIIDINKFNF